MRTKLLMMSTAALLAGTLAAASQSIQPGGSAQEKGASSGQGQPSKEQPGKEQSSKELPGKPAPNRNAQSSQGTHDQAQGKEPSTSSPAKGKELPTTNGQATGGRDEDRARGNAQGNGQGSQDKKPQGQTQREQDRQRPQTEGQAPRDQDRQQQGQTQREQDRQRPGQTEGQAQAPRDQDRQQQGQTQREQDRSQQGEREGQRSGGVSVSFTTEQRTRIRETVFKEKNAPRMSKVDFSLNVGTAVPRTVHVIEMPQVIVDIHPEWRGYRYFIVNEELVVVDPDTLRIIAIIDV
jgi:hypothetical protein